MKDELNKIKIRVYWLFPVNKRQFLIAYGLFTFTFLTLAIVFLFVEIPYNNESGDFTKFMSRNFSLVWILSLFWIIIEGQFFWQKFTRKQMSLIEQQRDRIREFNEELKTRNEEIISQRDEIEAQNFILSDQKEQILLQQTEIMDSIRYAFRIQTAILPPAYNVSDCLKEGFILYLPKAVVSGDFYFVERLENKVVVAAVDCTGHGVPGAMMSVIGYNLLNQAVKLQHILNPAEILSFLDNGVTEILRQTNNESGVKDGMDITVCVFEEGSTTVEIAGAYNPAYVVSNGELSEIKADKLPIGVNVDGKVDNYTCHTLNLKKGDMVYLFSDGYADQFGGPLGKKFKYKSLREMLVSYSNLNTIEQKEKYTARFNDWKGSLEQVDDVLLIGIRI